MLVDNCLLPKHTTVRGFKDDDDDDTYSIGWPAPADQGLEDMMLIDSYFDDEIKLLMDGLAVKDNRAKIN